MKYSFRPAERYIETKRGSFVMGPFTVRYQRGFHGLYTRYAIQIDDTVLRYQLSMPCVEDCWQALREFPRNKLSEEQWREINASMSSRVIPRVPRPIIGQPAAPSKFERSPSGRPIIK